jgi:hypothetical protein
MYNICDDLQFATVYPQPLAPSGGEVLPKPNARSAPVLIYELDPGRPKIARAVETAFQVKLHTASAPELTTTGGGETTAEAKDYAPCNTRPNRQS